MKHSEEVEKARKNIHPVVEPVEDKAKFVLKSFASLAPVVGGLAVEALNRFLEDPVEKRQEIWAEAIVTCLAALEDDMDELHARLVSLREDDEFVSTVIMATRIAITTHQEEKLKQLKNAIGNSASSNAPDFMHRQIYLNYVDDFTVLHVEVMRFVLRKGEVSYKGAKDNPINEVIAADNFFDELCRAGCCFVGQRDIYDHVVGDLEGKKLIIVDNSTFITCKISMTGWGEKFIEFIS